MANKEVVYKYVTLHQATDKYDAGWLAQVYVPDSSGCKGKQVIVGSRHPTALAAAQTAAKYLTAHGIPTTVQMLKKSGLRGQKIQKREDSDAEMSNRLSKYQHVYRWAGPGRRPQWQAVVGGVTLGCRAIEEEAGQLVRKSKMHFLGLNLWGQDWV